MIETTTQQYPMIVHGIDIVEVDRINGARKQWGKRFLDRIFTPSENSSLIFSLAVHFAAKEAVMKTLGWRRIGWKDIEILPDAEGKPLIKLHGKAKKRSMEIGLINLSLSISHTRHFALASAVGEIKRIDGGKSIWLGRQPTILLVGALITGGRAL